jgi:hypothetical protein
MLTAEDVRDIVSESRAALMHGTMYDTTPTTVSMRDVKKLARTLATSIPEYVALKTCLEAERPPVRKAVATVLFDWAFDPVTDMTPEEQEVFLARVKAELRRRGASVPGET